jgi:hypothetical protein
MSVLSLLWTDAATVFPWQEVSRVHAGAGAGRVVRSAASLPGRQTRREPVGQPVDSGVARQGRLRRGNMCSWSDSQEVVTMAGDARTGRLQNILNTDGHPHPVENAMTILVLVSGLVSFVLGLVVRNVHTGKAAIIIATVTGLFALLVGLYIQMVSSTRNQRVLIVAGIIAGFVGLAIGLSKGGFSP